MLSGHVSSSLWSNVSKVTSLCGRSLNQWVSDSQLLSCSGQLKTKKKINYILVIVMPQSFDHLFLKGLTLSAQETLEAVEEAWRETKFGGSDSIMSPNITGTKQFNSISHDDLLSNRSIRSRSQWLMICGRGTKCVIETSEFHLTVWGAWVEWEMWKSIMLQNDSFVLNKNIRLGIHTASWLIPVVIVKCNAVLLCAF